MTLSAAQPTISVFGSKVGLEESEEARTSIEAQWMGMGPKVRQFEDEFSRRLGLTGLAMIDSGSNSLHVAVKVLGLEPGSEVVLPSFTWVACAHAVVLCGCVPVFCDVDLHTHNVTAETIEPHITDKTAAIMVVHYAGKPVEMRDVNALGLPVIEDAAHAVDSRLDGKACGSLGTVGVYSFDPVKNLATCDGGGVTASDPELVKRARALRYCGIAKSGFAASSDGGRWWEYDISEAFPRFLPNDVSAGIALAQLRKLDQSQATRKLLWERYQEELADVSWLARPQDPAPDEQHSYFTYCIRLLNGRRNELAKHLYDLGIYTTLRYHPLHLNRIYRSAVRLPASEQLNDEALNLPLHPSLEEAHIARIVDAVRGFGATSGGAPPFPEKPEPVRRSPS